MMPDGAKDDGSYKGHAAKGSNEQAKGNCTVKELHHICWLNHSEVSGIKQIRNHDHNDDSEYDCVLPDKMHTLAELGEVTALCFSSFRFFVMEHNGGHGQPDEQRGEGERSSVQPE